MNRSSASGERAAASGFRGQYSISAKLVLDALNAGNLEWIKIADPAAGQVDDFQIATAARVDAYQIKWSQYPAAVTLNSLLQAGVNKLSLMQQLANGWKGLRQQHPGIHVVVHLATNEFPSANSQAFMPSATNTPTPYHFAAFIEQAWKPYKEDRGVSFDGPWQAVWRSLQAHTGLSEEEFPSFVKSCSLDFRVPAPDEDSETSQIADLLFASAAGPEHVITLSRHELIERLKWKHKYSEWNAHEFPEPRYTYHPIQTTVDNLKSRLGELEGGYIGVFGPPGSGKSTLLTQTLRTFPVRLIRYYAYVPDSQDPTTIRGEVLSYLHHVTLALKQAGFGKRSIHDHTNRIEFIQLLNEQIKELGIDYTNTGQKTVLMIDGLDHIEREQNPERSLLNDLPLPDEIPPGVYFVLGSQTAELSKLPLKIRGELELDNRRVEMGRISKADVANISTAAAPNLSESEIERIFELSGGHPLALIYLLKHIQSVPLNEREKEITATTPYTGDIDALYFSYWQTFSEDVELINTLGLLCRIKGPISLEWVSIWASQAVLIKLGRLLRMYFEKDGLDRWEFFHNSFRLFLMQKTAEVYPGRTKEQRHRDLHKELANLYKISEPPHSWECLYHYHSADDHQSVAELSKWEWFTSQIRSLRPLDAIQTDIKLALQSAAKLQNLALVARFTLLGAAVQQRLRILEGHPVAKLLLESDEPILSANYLRDGNKLRIENEEALSISAGLFKSGLRREAYRVFELAEPHELLSGKVIPDDYTRPQNLRRLLGAWVRSAILFRDKAEIINTVKRIKLSAREGLQEAKETTTDLQGWLLFQAAIAASDFGEWEMWEAVLGTFDAKHHQTESLFALLRSAQQAKEKDPDRAKSILELLTAKFSSQVLKLEDDQSRIEAAISLVELVLADQSKDTRSLKYIENIAPIPLYNPDLGFDEKPLQVSTRFRLARLKYLLDPSKEPVELTNEAERVTTFNQYTEEDQKSIYRNIAHAAYTAAKLWARGETGQPVSPTTFIQETKWIVDLFGSNWNTIPVRIRMGSSESRSDIFTCLISAAQKNGEEVLSTLAESVATNWIHMNKSSGWHTGLQRKLVTRLSKAGIEKLWVQSQLQRIEASMMNGLDPDGRAQECREQAEAWLLIGEKDKALNELRKMTDAARGILSDKDYQLVELIKWMGEANNIDTQGRETRTQQMLRKIVSIQDTASGISNACEEMIKVTYRYSPQLSAELLKSMLELNLVSHHEGLCSFLEETLAADRVPHEAVTQTLVNLVFPFVNGSDPSILKTLLHAVFNNKGANEVLDLSRRLARSISISVLEKNRLGWLSGLLEGLQDIGLPTDELKMFIREKYNEERSGSGLDHNLHYKTGESISPSSALLQIETIESLRTALENEDTDKTKFFDWVSIAEKLAPQLSAQGLGELEALIAPRASREFASETRMARLYLALSKGYVGLRNQVAGLAYAQRALETSSASGWDPYYDGGVKHKVLLHLKTLAPDFSEVAFNLYARDISEQFYYPTNLVIHLREIVDILAVEPMTAEVWAEIELYLKDLFVNSDLSQSTQLEKELGTRGSAIANDSPEAALIDMLLNYLSHPSYAVAQGAVQSLASLLKSVDTVIVDKLKLALLRDDETAERCLMAIESGALAKSKVLDLFQSELLDLCGSKNFLVRLLATKLISWNNNEPAVAKSLSIKLPASYQLHLPETSLHRTEVATDVQSGILLGDPARILRPLDIEFRKIANAAGLAPENVFHRAMKFFDKFSSSHTWFNDGKPIAEKRLNAFLDNTGLRISHNRPHISPARQALAYVISELWDAGLLKAHHFSHLQNALIRHDPYFIPKMPTEKPIFIESIVGQEQSSAYIRFSEDWVARAKEALSIPISQTPDGQIVLGEHTKLKYLEDQWPTETRYSLLKGKEGIFGLEEELQKGRPPFHGATDLLASDYIKIKAPVEDIVISSDARILETRGQNWLALNPTVGRLLGWELKDDEEYFSWVNSDGKRMVSSIWWESGNINSFDHLAREETAAGWLVLASPPGYAELKAYFPELYRCVAITRQMGWQGNSGSKQEIEIKPVEI